MLSQEKVTETVEKLMEYMVMRGMSADTQIKYEQCVKQFLESTNREIEELEVRDAREYLIEMAKTGKWSEGTINNYNAALRLFYAVSLDKQINYLQLPRFKEKKRLPELMSREEIESLIQNNGNIKHKAIYMLAYGSGLRVSEIAKLRVKDIDSKTMRIFVADGKGGKDRYTILPQKCLEILRKYWLKYKPNHPEGWLFPRDDNKGHMERHTVTRLFWEYAKKTGITKKVSMHTLRHAFATHLLEDGVDLFRIKELLGHVHLNATVVYLHLGNPTSEIKSPADSLRIEL